MEKKNGKNRHPGSLLSVGSSDIASHDRICRGKGAQARILRCLTALCGSIARVAWIEEVNKALKGRFKIVDYPGGQLYGPKDMHKAVAKGGVDLGVVLSTGKIHSDQTMANARGWEQKFTVELAKAGATITTIAPEERAKIKAVAKLIWEKWARENGKDAQRLLELNAR